VRSVPLLGDPDNVTDGHPPRKEKEPAKPTWTERSVPEHVKPEAPPTAVNFEDVNALIPAADPVVQAAYKRTGMLPVRPIMNRGDSGSDALVIQKGAKQTRVLNFTVEGIHWRAGFSPEVAHTPLGQFVQDQLPPEHEVLTGTGFVLRPIEAELEAVLRDIVPAPLLKLEDEMFSNKRQLGVAYLYFIPHSSGATAGIVAWYVLTGNTRAHLLYLQTEIKRADVRILDEMLKTFRASLVARHSSDPAPRAFDFWGELAEAGERVEESYRNSALGRGEVGQRVTDVREHAEERLYNNLNSGFGRLGVWAKTLFVRVPQLVIAGTIRLLSRGAVVVIRFVDRLLARSPE
jgi:hypothetical protein